ncbi:MAG TPA: hypothetical protein VMU11_03510 [Verrucomicrobiae bacterium]|nr:hypothetical protein [Verrucomicrobiae bacterium]
MDGPQRSMNPFQAPERRESAGAKYERVANQLARRFIYDEEELDPIAIERAIERARSDRDIASEERMHGELETLFDLLKGMAAHERANELYLGAWQAALIRQKATAANKPKPPEHLTRHEVAQEFEAFDFKKTLLYQERESLTSYRRLLERNPQASIRLSERISIDHTDVEALVIDLRVREAERLEDEAERKRRLAELDRELSVLITRLPPEQAGKRLELEELYLLRRLIHGADTGHLVSANHGTPREDLRPDRGSVDLMVTAAGDVLEFQMKTFKTATHQEAKAIQAEALERAQRKLAGSSTRLVVLEQEAVHETYEAALRQGEVRHSRSDKYAALEPLVESLRIKERERLLALFGLTEEDLTQERAEFERRQAGRREHEEEMRRKREEEERRFAEAAERQAAKQREGLEAERERQARIDADKEKKLRESMERMEREREASERKLREIEERQQASQTAARKAQEEAKQKAAKAEAKAAKEGEKKWAEAKLAELGKPDSLIGLGLLAKEERNVPAAILAAKKLLAARYPNAKAVLKEFPFEK